jgi:hypothetical protein
LRRHSWKGRQASSPSSRIIGIRREANGAPLVVDFCVLNPLGASSLFAEEHPVHSAQ